MAELMTAIEDIKIGDLMEVCDKYNYYFPLEVVNKMENNKEKNISVIYGDEFTPIDLKSNRLTVKKPFPLEMLEEINSPNFHRRNYKYDDNEIQMIFELVKSLNQGNWNYSHLRVDEAIHQYAKFKREVINKRKED